MKTAAIPLLPWRRSGSPSFSCFQRGYPVSSFLLVGVVWAVARYNGVVRARKRVEEAWSGIDVQLRRRASLLPNLEEIVKGYAAHEREVFIEVARARGALQKAGGAGEAANANETLSQAFIRMFAVAENYPQLRASESFIALRNDLLRSKKRLRSRGSSTIATYWTTTPGSRPIRTRSSPALSTSHLRSSSRATRRRGRKFG
jgi:hypothetical protein